jgi:transcription elongation factor Elf1
MTDKAAKTEKTAKKSQEIVQESELVFTCKFCGETKPLIELVVMRQFFPAISSCKACAKATRNAPGT